MAKCKKGYVMKEGFCVKDNLIRKLRRNKKVSKFMKNFKLAGGLGLATIFVWMIGQGTLRLFPQIGGVIMIIIGIVGLSILGYLGWRKIL